MFSSEFTTTEYSSEIEKNLVKIHKTVRIGLAKANEHNIPYGFNLYGECGAHAEETMLEAVPPHVAHPEDFNDEFYTLVRCEKCWPELKP